MDRGEDLVQQGVLRALERLAAGRGVSPENVVSQHLAAVLYGVGIRLDARPELFFVLRRVDQAELLSSATAGALSRARPAVGKRIADDRLSAVFGIELEDAPPAGTRRAGRAPRRGGRRR